MPDTTEIVPNKSSCPRCGASAENAYAHAPTCPINTLKPLPRGNWLNAILRPDAGLADRP